MNFTLVFLTDVMRAVCIAVTIFGIAFVGVLVADVAKGLAHCHKCKREGMAVGRRCNTCGSRVFN